MALPESSLSIICASVRDFVRLGIDAVGNNINVLIGAPAEIVEEGEHRVSMFFYRFEPGGFQANAHPQDPWSIRLFCMITAFGIEDDGVPAGENDLRILGEIVRVFREAPVLSAVDVNGESIRLQVIFSPATDEQINQVWSTQGDVTYRPSVIYEMALAVIMPSQLQVEASLVASIGSQARGSMTTRYEDFDGVARGPVVRAVNINTANPYWQPVISWIYDNECAHTLSFDIDSEAFDDFTAQIWVAGDTNEEIQLQWESWQSDTGWQQTGDAINVTPFTQSLEPDNIPDVIADTFPFQPGQPISIADGETAAQGMLYAIRNVVVNEGQPAMQIRSNPLLLNLYRVEDA